MSTAIQTETFRVVRTLHVEAIYGNQIRFAIDEPDGAWWDVPQEVLPFNNLKEGDEVKVQFWIEERFNASSGAN